MNALDLLITDRVAKATFLLVPLARDQEIPGRSGMSAEELAATVARG